MGSFSIWHWLIVLLVVVLIFGTKKLRNLGGDVGGAVKGFKDALNEEKNAPDPSTTASVSSTAKAQEVLVLESRSVEVPAMKAPSKKRAPVAKKAAATKVAAKKAVASKPAEDKPKTAAKKSAVTKPKAAAKKADSESE